MFAQCARLNEEMADPLDVWRSLREGPASRAIVRRAQIPAQEMHLTSLRLTGRMQPALAGFMEQDISIGIIDS